MEIVVLGIHLLVAVCLIFLVLMQRSEGGALGMGGGGGSLMSGRGAADALARMTSVAGGFFLVTSLGLTMLSGADAANSGRSVLDAVPARTAPASQPDVPAMPQREDPTESSVAPETQLASVEQPPTATPPSAPARAAPLEASQPAAAQPSRTQTASVNRPTASPTATSAAATRAPAPQNSPVRTQPTSSTPSNGAVSGINLSDDPAAAVESSQTGVEAVRRERAGPDQ